MEASKKLFSDSLFLDFDSFYLFTVKKKCYNSDKWFEFLISSKL